MTTAGAAWTLFANSDSVARPDRANDLFVADVRRRHELRAWFLAEHHIDTVVRPRWVAPLQSLRR